MSTITIPKKYISNDDLVIIPRKKYETLLKYFEKKSTTIKNDWVYDEPYKSSILKRIQDSKKELKKLKLI